MKKWEVANKFQISNSKFQIREIINILLENRGIKNSKDQEKFLTPPNPYELTAKRLGIDSGELNKAVERIKKAIEKKEKIIIYGDYDSDGICATAIMWETLWKMKADVLPYIPIREEGYGMKNDKLDEFFKKGVSLVITVDNGIVNYEQINHAKKIGLDLIITDHHISDKDNEKDKNKALATIHTTALCGAGVSWFLANQLKKTDLDLVTIGTVTDLMPLVGVNRSIVYHGLEHLRKTNRIGLQELFKAAAIDPSKIGTYEIGYLIGPRLNAAGRMENPIDALRLVCTSKKEQAAELAQKLDQQNRTRQSLTEEMTNQARANWLKEDSSNKLIFVSSDNWEYGIIGLVAGKLTEEFYKPTVVVAVQGDVCRASARSVNGFNIIEAIRLNCAELLGSHGGHSMAAGFDTETKNLKLIKDKLVNYANLRLKPEDLIPTVKIDLGLNLDDLSFSLYEQIQKLEPFGLDNYEPVFMTKGVLIESFRTVGRDNKHLSFYLKSETGCRVRAIGFGMGSLISKISPGDSIDIAYNLVSDDWNGNHNLQLRLKDLNIC